MSPAKLQSLLQNGLIHHRAGRLTEAEALYRQARAAAPRNFDVLHASGLLARQQNRLGEAIDHFARALQVKPAAVLCEVRLAGALLAARRLGEAEQHLRHALAAKPDFPEAWDQLGQCLKAQDRLDEAVACHERAVTLKPEYAAGWVNLGFVRRLLGQPLEALRCHERGRAVASDFAPARFGRAQALQALHRIREAVAEYDAFLRLQPQSHEARSNRLFALHNLEDIPREQLFAEHVAYGKALPAARPAEFDARPEPGRRLRVGILSPDLRGHACAYFLEPLLQHLDRQAFEIHLYHDHFREDAVSARLRTLAASWRNFSGQGGAAVEQQLRADQIDVLVDLAGHTGITNRLPVLARRVAPVQITYLGYPDTTGVPAMDYRFTDDLADPAPEADALATERLVRFAPTAWSYRPPAEAPEVASPPSQETGYVTFGSFCDPAKYTETMFGVWARILAQVPGSRLLLKGKGVGDPALRPHLESRLTRVGIDSDCVALVDRTPDTASHLAWYGRVDVALDTFPYHGTTTTCEALWMGVPVVSLCGDRHVARVGRSLLTAAGHPEWSVESSDAYVATAVALARDPARLADLRAGLRADLQRGPLLDHAGQAARFGAAVRRCWAAWCERAPVGATGVLP